MIPKLNFNSDLGVVQEEKEKMPPNEAQLLNAAKNAETADSNVDNVKFTGKNNNAKIEMGEKNSTNKQEDFDAGDDLYRALTKDELMQFANDPFWVRLRWALFAMFWLVWVGMLVASVVILIMPKKCPSPEPKEWWQKAPVYDITTSRSSHSRTPFDIDAIDEVRRRGKNRIAATICREKRRERREKLKTEADRLQQLKEESKRKNEHLRRELDAWQERAEDVSKQILKGAGLEPNTAFLDSNESGIKIITKL